MKVDVVITFYDQQDKWPLVLWGLMHNKQHINKVIISKDGKWDGWTPQAPGSGLTTLLVEREHKGWGAGRAINEAVKHVTTDIFCHIDADMALAPDSLLTSTRYMQDIGLLAGVVVDTSKDVKLHRIGEDMFMNCQQLRYDNRHIQFRSPLPLNLRHGHYLASTSKWRDLGGIPCDEFMVEGVDSYFSMDYVLAAKWMMAYGRDDFAFGGGSAYHCGGIYTALEEAESNVNKCKVRKYLDKYVEMYPDEGPCTWNDDVIPKLYGGKMLNMPQGYIDSQKMYNSRHKDGTVEGPGDANNYNDAIDKIKYYGGGTCKSILDVGCRTGYGVVKMQKELGCRVVGVDVVEEFVKLAQEKDVDALVADAHNLKFDSNAFDWVVCIGTFEHFYNSIAAAKELRRVGKMMYVTCDLRDKDEMLGSDYAASASPQAWEEVFTGAGWGVVNKTVDDEKVVFVLDGR